LPLFVCALVAARPAIGAYMRRVKGMVSQGDIFVAPAVIDIRGMSPIA